jgi:uncharacterized radical SAM protein YgiQ
VILTNEKPENALPLPKQEDVLKSKESFEEFYRLFYLNQNSLTLAQPTANRFLIHEPPPVINEKELDAIYELPYSKLPHPVYKNRIPAYEMIRNSILSHRGCVSGCSFCSLSLHQGRKIVSRSQKSVLREAQKLAADPCFKGHITDIGGPTANMYGINCILNWKCKRESCLYPAFCPNLKLNTQSWISLLKSAASLKGISKVTVGSGIRYDLLMKEKDGENILKTLIDSHISGQLKIAPENTSPKVLKAMRKTPLYDLRSFVNLFFKITKGSDKKQFLIPYLMSCHPGSDTKEIVETKRNIQSIFGFFPEQSQAFIPLPLTLSSVIYYTGRDPFTKETFFSCKTYEERKKQHAIFNT